MSELIVPVVTAIIGIFGTLLALWYRNKLEKAKLEKAKLDMECPIGKCVMEDAELLNKLEEILKEIKSDRISIYSYHNGGEYYSGKSMQKMSVSYEVVARGIARVQTERQSIPVSAAISTLKPVMVDKIMHFPNIKDYPESICKYKLIEDGVKSTYQWAIFDLHKRAIGMLRVDYIKKSKALSDDILNKITLNVIKMPGYLSGHK